MNAKPLFTEDREHVVAYFCSKCRIVKSTEADAEQCCRDRHCDCGAKIEERYKSSCDKCQREKFRAEKKSRISKMPIVQSPTSGMVYSDNTSYNEGFFKLDDIDSVFEEGEKPFFVYDCNIKKWSGLNASDIVEADLESDWYEDASDDVVYLDELEKFLSEWNKKQTLFCYECAERVIVLDQERFTAWLSES
ncbi:hypothetical protein RGL65_004405 [Vibrio parahaemolyticus]|nr:hypothetical protein [Vibrio parahaemolyticus]ELA8200307.1 hypothetical protein [Vibrio parahaemolyticus]